MILIALLVLPLLAVGYIAYFGLYAKPAWSLYAFIALWLFTPKIPLRGFLPLGTEWGAATGYNVIEVMATLAILLALWTREKARRRIRPFRPLARFCLLFAGAGALSFLISIAFQTDLVIIASISPASRLLPLLSMIYAGVFLFGCMAFITTLKQIETFLFLFVASGIELLFETLIFFYLRLFPALHTPGAIHYSGRFNSMAFMDFDMVGVISIVNLCATLYFIVTRRNHWMGALFPLLALPLLCTFQRAPFLGLLISLMVFAWLASGFLLRWSLLTIGLLCFALVAFSDGWKGTAQLVARSLGADVHTNYESDTTMFIRFGIYAGVLDLVVDRFPLGIGPGMVRYIVSDHVFPFSQEYVTPQWLAENREFSREYQNFRARVHATSTHNAYLEFVVENGLLGIVLLGLFFALLSRNVRASKSWLRSRVRNRNKANLALACSYAVLIGEGIFYMFESSTPSYLLFLMFFFFTFLLPTVATVSRSAPAPAVEAAHLPDQPLDMCLV